MNFVLRGILVVGGVGLLVGCATVRLDTPEPLKVDINMKVDVEQKGGTAGKVEMTTLSAGEERRMLSHQVQELKNDHKVGEGRDGLLVLKEMPKDQAYIDYAKTVVAKENGAREKLFAEKALIEKKSEAQYAKEFAQRVRQASYPGEWIQEDDGKWKKR